MNVIHKVLDKADEGALNLNDVVVHVAGRGHTDTGFDGRDGQNQIGTGGN